MTEFHRTRMGQTYYERTLPELVRQLVRLNENLEQYLKEKQDGENVREKNP